MAADFISLADYLHRRQRGTNAACPAGEVLPSPAPADGAEPKADIAARTGATSPDVAANESAGSDVVAALHDARMFRARLADAFDEAAARLLRELAAEVLVRELRLAPCDIEALIARLRKRAPVVRVRVAPDDVARMYGAPGVRVARDKVAHVHGVPVAADEALETGDAIVELAAGAVDARLGVRLANVLETFA